jgi:alpha-1,6-mannosyltransferase
VSWRAEGRYLVLGGALFGLLAAHSWTNAWAGDFWIYVATVSELAARPLHPSNPLLGNEYPFAFLSPYTLGLGLVAKATSLGAFDVLVLQGLVNLVLLLGALYFFTATWLRRPAAAFYALLFVLFLWGRDPWLFSSFFHLKSLSLVLPYPSTFAAALALGGLAAFPWVARTRRPVAIGLGVVLGAVLSIVHPVNALFFWMGVAVYAVGLPRPGRTLGAVALAFSASVALALAWPLFPVKDLWFGQIGQVHAGNAEMYDSPLPRVAPALLGVPWLLWRLRRNPRDPLALLAVALGLAVAYGGLFGRWSYGRLLSHAVLLCQIGLADALAAFEERLLTRPMGARLRPLLAPGTAVLLLALSWSPVVRPVLLEAGRGEADWLGFLRREIDRDDVVLTDLDNGWHVPAFHGRVVAYPMPLPFVPDQADRVEAVERFFTRETPREEREAILDRYGVAYILVPKGAPPHRAEPAQMRSFGHLAFENERYELLRRLAASGAQPPKRGRGSGGGGGRSSREDAEAPNTAWRLPSRRASR